MAKNKQEQLDELDAELKGFQSLAGEQNADYEKATEKLHKTLALAFAWWIKAECIGGNYLKQKFKSAGFNWKPSYSNNDERKFIPLIKLAWGMSEEIAKRKASSITQWNQTLMGIEKEYFRNPLGYEEDTAAKIENYIIASGGPTGVRRKAGFIAPITTVKKQEKSQSKAEQNLTEKLFKLQVQRVSDGKKFVSQTTNVKAVIKPLEPVLATEDHLVAMVGRLNENGEIELISTSDDDEIINAIAAETANSDISNAPPVLALLTEVIKTQVLPEKLLSKKSKLIDLAELLDEEGNVTGKVKAAQRMTICADTGVVLYSQNKADVGVVTKLKPKKPPLKDKENVYLNRHSLNIIETAFIYKNYLNYVTANPKTKFKKAKSGSKYAIDVKFKGTGYERSLFFAVPKKRGKKAFQVDVKEDALTKFTWGYKLSPSWASVVNSKFSGWWVNVADFGKQITRKDGSVVKLAFKSDLVEANFQKRDTYIHKNLIPFPSGCSVVKGLEEPVELEFLAKDIIPVLCSLPSMEFASGELELRGNDKLICFSFETKQGAYDVFVPAINGKGERYDTHFARFEY